MRLMVMEFWVDLLFGNPIGLLSVATVVGCVAVIGYLAALMVRKSGAKHS